MFKSIILLLIFSTFTIGQQSFSNEEILELANKIKVLQQSDSLKTVQIDKLEELVGKFEYQARTDSLLLAYKNEQIELLNERDKYYQEQINLVKPRWYQHRYLWFFYGAGTIIASSWVVSNIK